MPTDPMIARWRALAADPTSRQSWIETGKTLEKAGRREESRTVLATVLERWPDAADSWVAVSFGGRREAAEAAMLRATELAPEDPAVWRRLGEVISSQEPDRALQAFSTATSLNAQDAVAHRGAGLALQRLGRLKEAEQAFGKALTVMPADAAAHRLLAWLYMGRGDFAAGWRQLAQSRASLPNEWDGQNPSGKTIVVLAEGALDDALPLLGCVTELVKRGAKVVVSAPAAWVSLLVGLEGVSVRSHSEKLAEHNAVIPLPRLPWRLGLTDAAPDLRISPAKGTPVPRPLGTRLKVGLLWASTRAEDDGALGLDALLPLTGLAGAAFYGLQTGNRTAELKKVADPALITDLSTGLRNLGELAGTAAQMDLVIAVEGPMAYLARAVGTPVWLLLPRHVERPWSEATDLRFFRQDTAGDWHAPVKDMELSLDALLKQSPLPAAEEQPVLVNSIFPDAEGKPRYSMSAPRRFLSDPGVRYLVLRERSGTGYEYATRSFLDAHLQPDDLFIDIGAHWGIMSLQAATRWPGQVKVLAIEPSPDNQPHLKEWLADNGVEADIVRAFAADAPGRGQLAPQSTMGHSLIRADDGAIPVVTVDGLLADRPALKAASRVIVKIDVEGHEPEVIEGMKDLLATGKVTAVVWERGREYNTPEGQRRLAELRARFKSWGYSAWRFESEDKAGPLVPFVENGELGNIFELHADLTRSASYGTQRPPTMWQPVDPVLEASLKAAALFARGIGVHKQNKMVEARDLYRQAAALDSTQSGPYNNLGSILRNQSNRFAAAAAFRRALRLAPNDLGIMSNCGNAVREVGAFDEAEAIMRRAFVQCPNDAGTVYNLAVLRKDTDRPEQAVPVAVANALVSFDQVVASVDSVVNLFA